MSTYIIKSGDTLSKIAAANGTTVAALAAANGISNPNAIKAGASLTLPGSASVPMAPTPAAPANTASIQQQLDAAKAQALKIQAQIGGSSSAATPATANGITFEPTGNSTLDSVLTGITGVASKLISNGYTIPADLQITPDLVNQFLQYAHQNVDPYYKQQLDGEISNVNANLKNLATQYGISRDEAVQTFGTTLATNDNTAGANGVAFSGQRQLNNNNLVSTTNRTLASLDSNAAYNIGNALRTAGADVGQDNAGAINAPTLYGNTVGVGGGQRGTASANISNPLDFGYDPSIYKVGNIPSAQGAAAKSLQQTYLSNYGTLAGSQSSSGRSVSDLISMMGLT